jgi:cysteine-S-conjugate beta-lyase
MANSGDDPAGLAAETALVRAGRDKELTGQFINPPVIHASTVLFDSVDDMLERRQRYSYGRRGTPTIEALTGAVSALEGAAGTVLCPSGLSAVATALLACVSAGDQILMADCVYAPSRHFADVVLKRLGVETIYFDPAIGAGIESLFGGRTRAVYLESPGSLTFEMQDVPAIAAVARARGVTVIADNTWATPLYFKPLAHGVDLSLHAATKYLGGHSDVMLGTVSANAERWPALLETHQTLGLCAGPDDIYLTLRGMRTLAVRLERQMRSAIAVAEWLATRPEVERVLHPALAGDPGHQLWKRDMRGASGLFGFILAGWSETDAKRFIDGLRLFGIGASWGGFESLAILARVARTRTATAWRPEGPLIRLHIGLEDPGDLIADLTQSFAAVAASG